MPGSQTKLGTDEATLRAAQQAQSTAAPAPSGSAAVGKAAAKVTALHAQPSIMPATCCWGELAY